MVQTYRLLFETIEEAPALDIEYKTEKMASGGDFEDKISFLCCSNRLLIIKSSDLRNQISEKCCRRNEIRDTV